MSVKGFREVFARIDKTNFKTIGKILGTITVIGLIIIALVGIFSFLCTYIYKFAVSSYEIAKQYDLFRDLLTIILGIATVGISVVGVLVYYILRKLLEEKAGSAAKTEMTRSSAFLLNYVGYVYWRDYEASKQAQRAQYEYLSRAIELTESAYCDYASLLSERENELLICEIKNNLASYLAERQEFPQERKPEDKKIAQQFASYIYRRLSKFPKRKEEWYKTCHSILKKFNLLEKDLQN